MKNNLAIYGCGAFGKIFLEACEDKVDFFIDDFSTQSQYNGITIKKLVDIDKNTKILISVLQSSKIIEENLRNQGFSNILSFANSIKLLPEFLNIVSKRDYLWLIKDKKRLLDIEKLNLFKTFLKDIKSVDLLEKIVNFRKTFDMKYYIEPYDSEYFPTDVPIFNNISQMNFIDCGAYIGDTIHNLMNYYSKVNYCISFEPDLKNLENLNNQLESLTKLYPNTNFFVYPAGVYSSNKILSFSNQGIDSSASLVNSSDIKISVVSLDTIILNANPNYIKMDVEGAEKEAIWGARKTIKKYKPNLAICLYHKPEDLWEIPLLINEIEPNYEMYLRVHEDLCLSTVLYCIPKK